MDSFYSEEENKKLGFQMIGKNVKISRKACIYGAENIVIGNNVRIDDFCILSGKIKVGDYIHIAAYSALYAGDAGIIIQDFTNISSKVVIYAVSDDYSGEYMTNPLIPEKYKNTIKKEVFIEENVIIGSGCTILPGVTLKEGSSFGSMSLVKNNSEPWSVNVGIPAKKIKDRKKQLLDLEKRFLEDEKTIDKQNEVNIKVKR